MTEKPDIEDFIFLWFNDRHPEEMADCLDAYTLRYRDSGRLPKGEDAGTAAECEASQSGGEVASPEGIAHLSPRKSA